MINQTELLDFYEKKSEVRKTCLYNLLNLENHTSFLEISKLLPLVLKKRGLRKNDDNRVSLSPHSYFHHFLKDNEFKKIELSFTLQLFYGRSYLDIIKVEYKQGCLNFKSFLDIDDYREIIYSNSKIDIHLKELDKHIKILLEDLKKEMFLFKSEDGIVYNTYVNSVNSMLISEKKILSPLNDKFKSKEFLNSFLLEVQKRIKFKNTNIDDMTFYLNIGYDNLYTEYFRDKKPDFNFVLVIYLIDEESLNRCGDSKLLYIGSVKLNYNTLDKNFELGIFDNLKHLKNKTSLKKWGNSILKNIVFEAFDDSFK